MSDNILVKSSLRFHGSTFDDMVEIYTKNFGPFEASQLGRGADFLWQADFHTGGAATLVTSHYQVEWQARPLAEMPEWLSIAVPRIGGWGVALGRRVIDVKPGQVLLVNNKQPERFFLQGAPNMSDVLRLDWAVMKQTVAAMFEMPLNGSLDLTPILDLSTSAGQLVGNLVQTIIAGMRYNGPLIQSPMAMSYMVNALADLILRTTPHQLSHLLAKKPHLVAPRHVRRAIDFMHANIDRPITMQMVAEAVGVSIRALEGGFRAFRETTPMAYLRGIRLQAARADLLDQSNRTSIKEICLKWGFFHFGRFAVTYRQTFGETPSETRKRSGAEG
ncbi:AraC family transcriptional regulator [Rhizobium sp. LEGMi198b]|uniref:AraC family transcriptional regulator n=1 Tax=unclassified Rhizobium TaxID=2613769 RepID=UPI000CDF4153|nr:MULTISPECIES: AraC family transcriptional regulator [Rhizobium]AVA24498.1 AraC family transcriptional regulator protein [Rhizobium sp. NXC24]MDK4742194.1 AraC family transcriptional regulator [Rhizobium sp. CNPSo 3464]UWU24417.1 AraC family transcriptional regulator [Rhizobium tropici]WFU05395.1 AraC family transcriptional regulator [Rhizobium sp. CB3171]